MSSQISTRPTGITILSILAGLEALVLLFRGFVAMGAGSISSLGAATILGLAALALGGLFLVAGWGFWDSRPWAWALGVALAIAAVIVGVLGLIGSYGDAISAIVSIALPAVVLYYLNQPGIKTLFGR